MNGSRLRSTFLGLMLSLSMPLSVAGCGCPTALAGGVLVAQGSTLALDKASGGEIVPVRWPFGYGVRSEGDRLELTDLLGRVKARQGDRVTLPGGQSGDGGWAVCGEIGVIERAE